MWCLVCSVSYNRFHFRERFCYLVVYIIKCYAVMDISGSNYRFQYKTMLVTRGMGFVCELPLVVALYEHTTRRICHTTGHGSRFLLLPAGQLLFGCIVAFGGGGWLAVIIKRLFSVCLPVLIYFLHKLFRIMLRCCRNLLFYFFLGVRTGLDVGSINKHRFGRQITRFRYFIQYPGEYTFNRCSCKTVPEVIAHGREMRSFFL